jgi:regulator of Ty1 transposition protein 109
MASTLTAPQWLYLPPGDPTLNSLLFPPTSSSTANDTTDDRKSRALAMLVPTFDDDPKARFLVELVINNPAGKMRAGRTKRTMPEADDQPKEDVKRQRVNGNLQTDDARDVPQLAPSSQASTTDATASSTIKEIQDKRRTDERRLRQEDAAALASISWDNFWTRMGYRQECISGDVTGFFSMYVGLPPASSPTTTDDEQDSPPAEQTAHQVSHPLFGRIAAALLNHDFANRTLAIEATRMFLVQTQNIVVAEIGKDAWDRRCTGRVEKNDAGKAFQDVDVQGSTSGANQALPVVNVLQVKKKKKPVK